VQREVKEVRMASSPLQDLQKVRLALVELRRREAAAIASGSGELPTYAAGILNTTNWIGAVDKAIEDESRLASALGGEVAVAGKQQEVVRVQSKARPSRRNASTSGSTE
jgi:hypothetical protein